jgi:hypothetical protein
LVVGGATRENVHIPFRPISTGSVIRQQHHEMDPPLCGSTSRSHNEFKISDPALITGLATLLPPFYPASRSRAGR